MVSLQYAITPEQAGTLDGILRERVKRTPQAVAYRDFDVRQNQWRDYTWAQIAQQVARCRAALARERLQPGDRVAMMLRNSPDWVVWDHAALSLGLVVVPLHMLDRAENVAYILNDAECKVLLVGSLTQWQVLARDGARFPYLQRIVVVEPYTEPVDDTRLAAIERWLPDEEATIAEFDLPPRDPHGLATIIYTSGTTGRPKGVMLSHANILSNAYAGLQVLDIRPSDELLSFLPLSHAFERTCGYYLTMMAGTTVSYARSVQQLGEDLRTIRPTVLMSVPRIFQTVYGTIRAKLDAGPPFRKWLFEQAVEIGYARFEYQQRRAAWQPAFLLWPLLDALVARKVMERLGGNLRLAVSGGAALPPDLSRIFIGLGLPVIQGYGLTETSPISNANRIDNNLPASIGPTVPGVEVKLNEHGALLIRGPNIMLGYWKNPQATAAVIDAEGWFNSGDIARIDLQGRVYITGRLKEIIVMSNGEKVPPADIEAAIMRDPLFTQVMLVGEGKPYLSLLAVLNPEQWEKLAAEKGFGSDASELQTKPVQTALLARVAAQTRDQFPGYAQVRRITASFEPWTIDNGLMTPTLKLCRGRVAERGYAEIEAMYAGFSL